ncbi:MAG: hypothetical protein AB7T31_10015 [Gemmatimonadales bacterium]
MKPIRVAGLLVALWAWTAPIHASAQASIFVMGGATVPIGDYADYANTGWMAQAGAVFPVGPMGLSVGAGGFYGVNNHTVDGDKTNLYGGLGFLQYTIGDAAAFSPYVYAGGGFMTHSYKSDTFPEGSGSGLAVTAGAGVNIPLGGATGFAEGEYLTGLGDEVDGTDLFAISAGVSFSVGG